MLISNDLTPDLIFQGIPAYENVIDLVERPPTRARDPSTMQPNLPFWEPENVPVEEDLLRESIGRNGDVRCKVMGTSTLVSARSLVLQPDKEVLVSHVPGEMTRLLNQLVTSWLLGPSLDTCLARNSFWSIIRSLAESRPESCSELL